MGILGRNAFGIFFPSLSVPIVKILHVSNCRPAFLAQPRSDKHPPLLPWFHHHSNSTSGYLFFQPRSGPKKFERFVGKCLGRYKRTDRSVARTLFTRILQGTLFNRCRTVRNGTLQCSQNYFKDTSDNGRSNSNSIDLFANFDINLWLKESRDTLIERSRKMELCLLSWKFQVFFKARW